MPGQALHVYFDDAGCNAGKLGEQDFFWAGYLANSSFWEVFGRAWNAVLDGPPSLRYWHQSAARAEPARPHPFEALDDAQIREREARLCGLIGNNRSGIWPIAVRISNEDMAAHVTGKITFARELTKRENDLYGPPKLMASTHLVALLYAAKLCEKLQEGIAQLNLHCEGRKSDPYQVYAGKMWSVLRSAYPDKFGDLDFLDGKSRDTPQLQAADMLAWHISRRAKRPGVPDDSMWSIIGGQDLVMATASVDELKKHVAIWNRFDPSSTNPFSWP